MEPPPDDGIVLYSESHPRPVWWKRPWSWVRCQYARWRMSRYTIVEEIEVDEDTPAESLVRAILGFDP